MFQTIGSKDEVNNTKRSPKYRKDLHWTICFHWSAQYSIEIALRWAIRQESGPKCTQEIALSWTIRLWIRLLRIASRPGWCLGTSTRSAFQHRRPAMVVVMTTIMLTKRVCIVVVVDTMCSLPFSLKAFCQPWPSPWYPALPWYALP